MVGSMKPSVPQARCDGLGEMLRSAGRENDDGRFGALQHLPRRVVERAIAADDVEIAGHQSERLGIALLQGTQTGHRLLVGGVASELIAAEPLDGDDLALLQEAAHRVDVIEHGMLIEAHGASVEADEPRLRAADMAGDRLGVEPAIGGIAILRIAGRTHGEDRHRGLRAVIGNASDDGEAWAAMGAIGEGVAVAARERVEHFGRTVLTDSGVGRDLGMGRAADALGDAELAREIAAKGARLDLVDAAKRWTLALHALEEARNRAAAAADPHQNAVRVVQHFAHEAQLAGDAPHGRAEAHALHAAAHSDLDGACLLLRDGLMQVHGAAFHNSTRLLPESATTSVSEFADTL